MVIKSSLQDGFRITHQFLKSEESPDTIKSISIGHEQTLLFMVCVFCGWCSDKKIHAPKNDGLTCPDILKSIWLNSVHLDAGIYDFKESYFGNRLIQKLMKRWKALHFPCRFPFSLFSWKRLWSSKGPNIRWQTVVKWTPLPFQISQTLFGIWKNKPHSKNTKYE